MPLYEYQCDACSHRFERIQRFSDPPIETCPSCGGAVRKLLSSPAIQFKGSGWYITDYAKKSSDSSKGSESSGTAGGDSSSASPASSPGSSGGSGGSGNAGGSSSSSGSSGSSSSGSGS